MRAVEGRLPSAAEARAGHVAVVSERLARSFWPGRAAVGNVLEPLDDQVVAVVPDTKLAGFDMGNGYGQIYLPMASPAPTFIVRSSSAAPSDAALRDAVQTIRSIAPSAGITRAVTLDRALGDTVRERSYRAWLFGAFGVAALFIVTVGLTGVAAAAAARRTREVGIRIALGSTRAGVMRLFLRDQAARMTMGVIGGAIVSAWLVSYVRESLYQTSPYDGWVWAMSLLVLVTAAIAGVAAPAWQASRVDPVRALRVE
jgi:hypothetical protein